MCRFSSLLFSALYSTSLYDPPPPGQMIEDDVTRLAAPRHVPMLVPPQDWTKPNRGGFLRLHSQIMRTKGLRAQKDALRKADLSRIYDGLNCLGKVSENHSTTSYD